VLEAQISGYGGLGQEQPEEPEHTGLRPVQEAIGAASSVA
jgi:hypothetical protein